MLGCLLHLLIVQIDGSVPFPVLHNMFLSCLVFYVSIIFLKKVLKDSAIFASSIKISFLSTSIILEFLITFFQKIKEILFSRTTYYR